MFGLRAAGVVVLAILLGAATAKPSPSSYWAQEPTAAQEQAAWATAAKPGRAAMVCAARADGALGDCEVTLESPAGAGLGKAFWPRAPQSRVNRAAPHPPAVGGAVVIPKNSVKPDKSVDWM